MFDAVKLLQIRFVSPYFCHLHNIGKLCQTGNRDYIMVGFQFVPGEVRTHMKIYNVRKHFSDHPGNCPTLVWLSLAPSSPTHSLP